MERIEMLFGEAEIAGRVEALAEEISTAIAEPFLVVALLKGSFVIAADLLRALHRRDRHPAIEFMRLSSYGLETRSSGEVHLLGDVPTDVAGRPILLLDDIADSGRSLAYARALLEQRQAGVIRTCVLLDKPSRREVDVPVDFIGFSIDDLFVAGYGIDYAEKYRHLPYIGVVR